MRVMVFVKASKESEAGQLPDETLVAKMSAFNEKLVKAGVMLAADGLHPSAQGARVRFDNGKTTVIDGPFPETKELIAGFWIWKVKSLQDALEWLKQAPFGGGAEIEVRPIFELEDFAKNFSPEIGAKERRLREESASRT